MQAYEGNGISSDYKLSLHNDGYVSLDGEKLLGLGTMPTLNNLIGYINNMRQQVRLKRL